MTSSQDFALVQVPPRLKGTEAATLKSCLAEHRGRPVAVDFARVTQLGTQCLQVLLAARKTWQDEQTSFEIRNLTDEVRDSLRICGVAPSQIGAREIHDDA